MGKEDKKNKKILIYAGILIIAVFIAYSMTSGDEVQDGELDAFAQCITEAGAAMYGADWCPHCQNQKKMFGSSFEYVNYVECEQNKEACLQAGIRGYPTWKFQDGTEQSGEMTLMQLSQKTDCPLQ